MAYSPIAFIAPNYRDYGTYWLKAYTPGTTTPKIIGVDSSGSTTVAKLQLNVDGFLVSAGGSIVMAYIDGKFDAYLFSTEAKADANDTSGAIRVSDNMAPPSTGYIKFDNIAAMKAGNLTIGDIAICKSYYASGQLVDKLQFVVVAGGTGTDDGGSFHDLSNGNQAQIIKSEAISFYQFGAISNNVDSDNTSVKNCIAYLAANNLTLKVATTNTYFLITEEMTLPDNFSVSGSGWKSAIRQASLNQDIFILGDNCTVENCRLKVADGDNTAFVNCIYSENSINPIVRNNFLNSSGAGGCGIQLRNPSNATITNNIIYGGKWNGGTGTGASTADILFYSSVASSRHVISGNYCLSNNSQGIVSDALGRDSELIVTGNICVTLDPATCIEGGAWTEVATGGIRRHAILTGYNDPADNTSTVIVSNNICKNTRWTGIYNQATGAVPRKIIISNNICIDNGFETGNTLAGGIYISKAGNEQVIGNTVFNFKGSAASNVGGITVNGATTSAIKTVIKDNYVIDSLAHGVCISTNATGVIVDSNTFSGTVFSDILWTANAGNAAIGGHTFCRNTMTRVNATSASINCTSQASTIVTKIFDNVIKGFDNTTVSDSNTALRTTSPVGIVHFYNNEVETFYYGIYNSNFLVGTRIMNAGLNGNTFKDCNKGMTVGATANTVTIPLFDNVFENVTTKVDGRGGFIAGKPAIKFDDNVQIFVTTIPTTGSWIAGDRAYNSASVVGQPKSWRYTSAGAWASEGNL